MFGLPKDFNGQRLVGCTLDQICVNLNQIYLDFDKSLQIVVESALSYRQSNDYDELLIQVPQFDASLLRLLGQSIGKATGDKHGTLTLEFSDGQILRCLDTSSQYESYRIVVGGNELIV